MSGRQEYRDARRQVHRSAERIFGSRARMERVGWLLGDFRRPQARRLTPEEAALTPAYREIVRIYEVLRDHAERIERLEEALDLSLGASPPR